MKWEARLENAFIQFGNWYFNGRGWGDLAENMPLFWAVPYQELQARGYAANEIYGAGPGAGNAPNSAAAKGTYGWERSNRGISSSSMSECRSGNDSGGWLRVAPHRRAGARSGHRDRTRHH